MKKPMEDKKAIDILTVLLHKNILNEEEKEAVLSAIEILGWTKLIESKIETRKKRRT
ncbi:MAG: hypothetical protein G01um10148_1030 [Parcubacteria group bacterium Gr01-1014_8]|nr:MAG: hypothetical protein G01um10148_1030 [Parcubacteria group bacterium Gr01-1014_8]